MRPFGAFILTALLSATNGSAAEEANTGPTLSELIAQGYVAKATGELVMKRKLMPHMDQGIFVHGYRNPSCIGTPILTMQGPVDSCDVRDVWEYKTRFYRMAKDDVVFVCILSGPAGCHRVH